MTRYLILIASTLFAATSVCAEDTSKAHKFVILEQAVETSLAALTLPNDVPNSLFVRQCASCKSKLLKIDATTRFFIDGSAVAYKDIRALVGVSDNPMGIFYDANKETITRILVFGVPSNRY